MGVMWSLPRDLGERGKQELEPEGWKLGPLTRCRAVGAPHGDASLRGYPEPETSPAPYIPC